MQTFKSAVEEHFTIDVDFTWTEDAPKIYENIIWLDPINKPTEEYIQTLIDKDNKLEALRQLRIERDARLAQTDWRFRVDMNPSQEWIDYCQALRDLPSDPTKYYLDDNGLAIIEWPAQPN